MLTDNDSMVKVAILGNILPLCRFFGRERTNDIILSHLITYLNDRDPALRLALIQNISGISILLGPITFEQYILPLLVQTLIDSEELVVVAVLQTLKDLTKTGLIINRYFYDITTKVAPLMLHPNYWIRQLSLMVIVESASKLNTAEIYCILYPLIRTFFEFDVEFDFELMLASCKQPISRTAYNLLCSWSLRASKSLFWHQTPVTNDNLDAFGNKNVNFITKNFITKNYGFNNKNMKVAQTLKVSTIDNTEIPLTTEDKSWIDKFKTIGLSENDLWKIASLRDYVLRTSKLLTRKSELLLDRENSLISLNSLPTDLMPRNVFFDIEFSNDRNKSFIPTPLEAAHTDSVIDSSSLTNGNENKRPVRMEISSASSKNSLPAIIDAHGSLMFKAKSNATTTSNLKNIYVRLEPSSAHKDLLNHMDDEMNSSNFTIKDSYEGDAPTIKTFLKNVKILPNLREYKEFGPINEFEMDNDFFHKIKGNLVLNLLENEPNGIASLVTLNSNRPYIISGSVQGMVKLWDVQGLVSGEMYSSSLTFDCNSGITDLIRIPGYETIIVSTKEGNITLLRAIYNQQGQFKKFTKFHCIRKTKIKTDREPCDDEFGIRLKTLVTEDKSQLYVLTS